jgi:hypothetical protein
MTSLDSLLISAIIGVVSGIVALWRHTVVLNRQWQEDQQENARLIFALLQRLAFERGDKPPPTVSTPQSPDHAEAKKLALKELNGELEALLRQYLSDIPPRFSKP